MTLISEINSRCTRCGACLDECPNQAIVIGPVTFAIDTDFCDGHGNCIAVCPESAITNSAQPQKVPHRI
ncbi:MAG: 4Fe-4S binding protein [Bdellovibrionales bacterium]|nr:4Fe-4S binding protein [Bdellovibrionales bacterium]